MTFINTTKFTNNGYVAASTGSINVTSSSWTNSGTILTTGGTANLGGSFTLSGAGTFNASAGGSINITGTLTNTGNTITLNSATGSLGLNGGTISGGTISQSGGLLRLQAGTLSNVAITGSDLNLANVVHIAGTFSIADHNLNMASGSNLYFSGQSVDNLNITPAGSVTIYPEGSSAATVTFGSGVIIHGGAIINNNNAGDGVVNNGTILGDSATNSTNLNTTFVTNNGTLTASGGSINFGNNVTFTNNGQLILRNGTITDPSSLNVGAGTLTGSGTISAAVALASGSSLAFNIGGTTKGTLYDSLLFNGNLSLGNSSLKLFVTNGFTPTAGQTFTVVTMGNGDTINGVFQNVASGSLLPTADGTGEFTVTYSASQILLSNFQPVPEPGTITATGVTAAALLRRRRRKTRST